MSKVNYTQFSEEKKEVIEAVNESAFVEEVEEVIDEIESEEVEEEIESEEVIDEIESEEEEEEIEEPKDVIGFVVNCSRLNVRKEAKPNAAVIKIINRDARVKIDEENSTEDFYKVQTGGVVGFCMKEFIEIQ